MRHSPGDQPMELSYVGVRYQAPIGALIFGACWVHGPTVERTTATEGSEKRLVAALNSRSREDAAATRIVSAATRIVSGDQTGSNAPATAESVACYERRTVRGPTASFRPEVVSQTAAGVRITANLVSYDPAVCDLALGIWVETPRPAISTVCQE